jgi:hypothetical protein
MKPGMVQGMKGLRLVLVQPEQLKAAQTIHDLCPVWCRSEAALDALAWVMKSNTDTSEVLIKTCAIDALYGTRVRWIDRQRVVDHVHCTLANCDHHQVTTADPKLVEDLAAVELADKIIRRYKSFASKYAHFFVNPSFPILDRFAVFGLRECLGRKALRMEPTYTAFAQAFSTLAQGLDSDTRRLDHYLWLIGQYHRRAVGRINPEIREAFDAHPRVVAQLIG